MNNFGRIFRVNIFGESHNDYVGVVIDGCPPGIRIGENDFFEDLARRKSGAIGTTLRKEDDIPLIKSGVYNGFTTGTPILILFENKNTISKDYNFEGFFRPGHADFVANRKYKGFNNPVGSGHFSGRLTIGLVAAGVIAKKILKDIVIRAELVYAGGSSEVNTKIEEALKLGDSIGGIVECRINNMYIGIGEPFFDSIESYISHLVFSIPGAKAIEFGEGIKSAEVFGSEFNDVFIDEKGTTKTNNAGGINGGISNGNEIYFRVWFKPASSISKNQVTYNFKTKTLQDFKIFGRHDACYVRRTPVIVEAVAAIAIADLYLINKSIL